jgi:hypothetical protein
MDRVSFRVAALAAAALLVLACADARADPGAGTPELATSGAEQSPPPDAQPTPEPAEGATAEEGSMDEGAMGSQQEGVEPQLAQEPPAGDPPVQRQGLASPSGPPPSAMTSPGGPEGQAGAPDLGVQPIGGSAPSAPELPVVAKSASTPAPPLGAIEPGQMGGARAPPDSGPRGSGVERLLPGVERELRTVQAQIDDLARRLEKGAPAPKSHLIRLRSSLERITPSLLALEVQLDAAGRLGPRLRTLLHRVRIRLVGARASAADLIAALRHVRARGPELRLLLRELGRFRLLQVESASKLGAERAAARSELTANAAYTQLQPAPAASPQHAATTPLERPAAGRQATGSPDHGGPVEPAPRSSADGSATATPGGASSAASLALLAALLIVLVLPRLRARLAPSPGRRYTVAFLTPLERPG